MPRDPTEAEPGESGDRPERGEDPKVSGSGEEFVSDRFVSSLPFLFGGGLSLFLAYSLREAPSRAGVPPFWVLFLAIGVIALVAGAALVLSREPEGDQDEDGAEDGVPVEGGRGDTVAVPKAEWARVQRELERLRGSSSTDTVTKGTRAPAGARHAHERPPKERTSGNLAPRASTDAAVREGG